MDLAAFCVLAVLGSGAAAWGRKHLDDDDDNELYFVDADNHELRSSNRNRNNVLAPFLSKAHTSTNTSPQHGSLQLWHRATYLLVMHDPPDMFYEPKEWSHTAVLLLRDAVTGKLALPGGTLRRHESFEGAAVRHLIAQTAIDVHAPSNCLQNLFLFPYDERVEHERQTKAAAAKQARQKKNPNNSNQASGATSVPQKADGDNHHQVNLETSRTKSGDMRNKIIQAGDDVTEAATVMPRTPLKQWADLMEVVYRGTVQGLGSTVSKNLVRLSLEQLKTAVTESPQEFDHVTYHAIRLYFQRQLELRAKRRLLKGYSSVDLERYGLRHQESSGAASVGETTSCASSSSNIPQKIVLMADQDDSERGQAVDYTMQTDDGMSPRLLTKADVVLVGVSRSGKTPLSLLLSQTAALRVANIPLVVELPPPRQLLLVDARRVFLITQSAEHLVHVRQNRLRRELRGTRGGQNGQRSTYADPDYVQQDLEKAKKLAIDRGYTILDLTDRAMEEAVSIISSKIKERFPDTDVGDTVME